MLKGIAVVKVMRVVASYSVGVRWKDDAILPIRTIPRALTANCVSS